jgi:hypothetical protein
MTPRRSILTVARFTGAYMLAALVAALLLGNGEFLFYIVTMLVIVAGVWVVHRRVQLTPGPLWGLSAWGLAHMAGGLVPLPAGWPYNPPNAVLYSLWLIPEHLKYDQVVHAYGFGITTWVCWQGLKAMTGAARPSFGMLVLAGAAALGFGALNEIIEFVATLTLPHTNVGGYVNTGWDLVSNLVGIVVAMVLLGACGGSREGLTTDARADGSGGPPPGDAAAS